MLQFSGVIEERDQAEAQSGCSLKPMVVQVDNSRLAMPFQLLFSTGEVLCEIRGLKKCDLMAFVKTEISQEELPLPFMIPRGEGEKEPVISVPPLAGRSCPPRLRGKGSF